MTDLSRHWVGKWLILCVLVSTCHAAAAQYCMGIKNMNILNMAKQADLRKLDNVTLKSSSLIAAEGFKFVQLRSSQTFVLVPANFKSKVVDFRQLSRGPGSQILDLTKLGIRLRCSSQLSTQSGSCTYDRQNQRTLKCTQGCSEGWTLADLKAEHTVIIPRYRPRSH